MPSNPVAAGATFNLLFVAADGNGNVVEFTGSGTVTNGTLTGTGSCSPSTPMCQGLSGTFSGNQQSMRLSKMDVHLHTTGWNVMALGSVKGKHNEK